MKKFFLNHLRTLNPKKIIIKTLVKMVIVFAISFIFQACNKDYQTTVINKDVSKEEFLEVYLGNSLTNTNREDIANLHNQYLGETMAEIDWSSSDLNQNSMNVFQSKFDPSSGISQQQYNDLLSQSSNDINQYIENDIIFNELKQSIEDIINSEPSFTNIATQLDLLKTSSCTTLIGKDLDAALIMIEVSKKSAYYWLPISRGGSGTGDQYIENYKEENDLPGAPNLGKLCLADGVGAAFGFILVGFLAVPTPLTLGALCMAVGLKAAESSLTYLLTSFD
jgi:hypothetical protein